MKKSLLSFPSLSFFNRGKNKSMPTGFTLIELLVVVLIIGILAAIAVPQYQKSVERSRATEAFLNLKTLTDAVERYHLEHGQYPPKFEFLDIELPMTCVNILCYGKNFTYRIDSLFVSASDTKETYALEQRFDSDRFYCIVKPSGNKKSKDLCKSLDPNMVFSHANQGNDYYIIKK